MDINSPLAKNLAIILLSLTDTKVGETSVIKNNFSFEHQLPLSLDLKHHPLALKVTNTGKVK